MSDYTIYNSYLKNNDCYKKAQLRNATLGIIMHSTGCNNPNLKRYVNNESLLGKSGQNHWDKPGISKCVHFMIGRGKNGKVIIVQTLPLNYKCWGCGSGKNGSDNSTHVQYEILEDDLRDPEYYHECMKAADWLNAYLCKKLNLKPSSIISHHEAWAKGYATNHGDPENWMRVMGDSMDEARNRAQLILTPPASPVPVVKPAVKNPQSYESARMKDPAVAGDYVATAKTSLNIRKGPGTNQISLGKIKGGSVVHCYGFYTQMGATRWYLVVAKIDGKEVTGYCSGTYLKKRG